MPNGRKYMWIYLINKKDKKKYLVRLYCASVYNNLQLAGIRTCLRWLDGSGINNAYWYQGNLLHLILMDANIVNSYVVPTAMGRNIALRHKLLINKAHCKMSANGNIFPHWGEKQTNTAWCLAITCLRELGWEMTNDCSVLEILRFLWESRAKWALLS